MSQKKVKQNSKPAEEKTLPDPVCKTYFLLAPDVIDSTATYTKNRVTVVHDEDSYIRVIDNGNGYEITDVSPNGGTKKIDMDYALAADLFAALKIFYHNAGKVNGEYWTIFQGEKL